MKLKAIYGISLFATLLISSCASHKNCGSTLEDKKSTQKLYSKRYKAAISERDSLCTLAALLQKDTSKNEEQIRSLRNLIDQKDKSYNSLKLASGEQLAKMNEELNKKQKELGDKEKTLVEKENRLRDLEKLIKERDEMLSKIMGTLRSALDAFPKDELNVETKNGKIYISMMDKLLFKSGSASVEPRGVEALTKLSRVLTSYTDIDIVIEGHTDNVPIKTAVFKDNWDLSTYRATSVLRILLGNNIHEKRLTASGKGEHSPVVANETVEGRAQNRRTELILTPKLDMLFKLLDAH